MNSVLLGSSLLPHRNTIIYLLLNKFILLGFDENMVMEAISDVTSIVAAVTVTSAVSSIFAPIDDALKFVLLLASRISEFNLTFTYSR